MSAPSRSPGRRLTVQGWISLVLAVMGVLVIAGATLTVVLLNRTDSISRELIDQIQPSRSAAYRLQAALRDQETAVRGYVISADQQFLQPYTDGQEAEQVAADDIRTRAGDHQVLVDDLNAIEAASNNWRIRYAEKQIAKVIPGVPTLPDPQIAEVGKLEFDRVRALFETQNTHLSEARTATLDRLAQAQQWRNRVLIAILLVLVVTAVALAVLVRSAVTRPLDALAAACRRITEGNFGERIVPQGPKDIRAIARDVEDMRQRIVDELDASRAARSRLADQASALDEQTIELRRSNAELEQFAYVASHDLQEPLRKVASFCQLLEKRYGDKLDERGIEYIGYAVDGAKRMQVLINDLLTFSRVGRLNTATVDVDLNAVLADGVANIATAVEETGAQIVLPDEPLPRVVGDPTLLTMLWQNLVGNAVKFHREGLAPRIVVDYEDGPEQGEWLFSVSDNGIGINQEFADKVFVIFQRLHGRDAYAGTGIGLALCKKIVEYHGGAIWIDTSYTDGTRFYFTLPASTADDAPGVQEGIPA